MTPNAGSSAPTVVDRVLGFVFVFMFMGLGGLWLVAVDEVPCPFRPPIEQFSSVVVQVRFADSVRWEDLDEPAFFPEPAFGHRTRLDRLFADEAAVGPIERQRLAEWIAARHATQNPHRPGIVAVRYLAFDTVVAAADPPDGHWRKPPASEIGLRQMRAIGSPCEIRPRRSGP